MGVEVAIVERITQVGRIFISVEKVFDMAGGLSVRVRPGVCVKMPPVFA